MSLGAGRSSTERIKLSPSVTVLSSSRLLCHHLALIRSNPVNLSASAPILSRGRLTRGASAWSRNSRTIVQALSKHIGHPFNDEDYMRIELLDRQPYGPMKILPANDQTANTCSGVLVFQRAHEPPLTPDTPIMEIFVAGDTACNIYTHLHGQKPSRPMVHDLMYNLLERAAEVNHAHWQLVRVAIVALENDVFVGRLFFGDAATGTVMWDCDCRPSDGVYLGLRTQCPFYVARKVWRAAAVRVAESKVHIIAAHEAQMAAAQQQQQQQPYTAQQQQQAGQHQTQPQLSGTSGSAATAPGGSGTSSGRTGVSPPEEASGAAGGASTSPSSDYTAIRLDDPDAIKLLKRELAVAVREEDYAAAIRLRDHPYLQLYRRIEAFQQLGRAHEAAALQRELAMMISRNEAASRK